MNVIWQQYSGEQHSTLSPSTGCTSCSQVSLHISVITIQLVALWVMTLNLICGYQHLRITHCLHLQGQNVRTLPLRVQYSFPSGWESKMLIWPAKGETMSVFHPWRCWLCSPPKHINPHMRLHCVTGQKTRPYYKFWQLWKPHTICNLDYFSIALTRTLDCMAKSSTGVLISP